MMVLRPAAIAGGSDSERERAEEKTGAVVSELVG